MIMKEFSPMKWILGVALASSRFSSLQLESSSRSSTIIGVSAWANGAYTVGFAKPIRLRSRFEINSFPNNRSTDVNDDCLENERDLLVSCMRTSDQELHTLVNRMSVYFGSMVDPQTKRFFLLSYPQGKIDSSTKSYYAHQHCPLRDLGSAWDATTALQLLLADENIEKNLSVATRLDCAQSLRGAILQTIKYYTSSFTPTIAGKEEEHGIFLSPEIVQEAPNIAHNGLLLLLLVEAERMSLGTPTEVDVAIDGLVKGILAMQRPDGAFRTYWTPVDSSRDNDSDDDVLRGIEFFSGEAMTALVEVFRWSTLFRISEGTCKRILPALVRALEFYSAYYEEGRRAGTIDTNYAIWQIQAFSRLVFVLSKNNTIENGSQIERKASSYCLELCDDIVRSPSWRMMSRGRSFYPNLSTVEIACGLDALVQGSLVASHDSSSFSSSKDNSLSLFARSIDDALDFLAWSQDRLSSDVAAGYGGLGYGGLQVLEQRLDVTGHALSATSKLISHRSKTENEWKIGSDSH